MNFNPFLLRAVVPLFVWWNFVAAAAEPAFPPAALSNAVAQGRTIIQAGMASKVPGLAVAVSIDGAIVWSQGFGYADLANKTPVTPVTRFRIGSVSKPLTAAGLVLLVEHGQLDLDAPVQKYIPDFPQKEAPITTRLLAGHLSGIRNYRGSEALSDVPYPNLRAGLKIFEADPLDAPPGTRFSYSSYNWNTIGVVMEAASKQDFLAYMNEKVIKPLGMSNTVPDRADVADPQRAQFYETDGAGQFIVAPPVDNSYKWPSGGYLSTAEDLARLGAAEMLPGFLKPESRQLLFTSQKTSDDTPTHYGVGWYVLQPVVYHGGDSIGGTSILFLLPESHIVVALVSNRGHAAFNRDAAGHLTVTKLADQMVFNREAIAQKIAKVFIPLLAQSEQAK